METNDTLKIERNPLWEELMCYYSCAIMEVETKFKVLDRQFSLEHERNPIVDIQSRLKSPESLLDKLERRGYERSLNSIEENIFDVAGVRIVTSFIDDVYMLGDCLVKQDDVKLLRRKDYIENPKRKWLPESTLNYRDSDFSSKWKKDDEGRSSIKNHSHGILGKSRS